MYEWNAGNGQLQKPNSTCQTERLQELNHVIIADTNYTTKQQQQ